jgi:hypothetical protein
MRSRTDNRDPDFSASAYKEDRYNDLAERLFASPPLELEELFDDHVRMRIGELISTAMIQSSGLPRRQRSRRRN